MKNLTNFKKAYSSAKKQATKNKIFNSAMLNLSYSDQKEFIIWQSKSN